MPVTCACGEQLLTVTETAWELGLSRQRVHQLIEAGTLKAQRVEVSLNGFLVLWGQDVWSYKASRAPQMPTDETERL